MAIDWRRRRPILGNVLGGLSGPAIKPITLRIVYQVSQVVKIPLVGIGGIATVDDAMEYFVAGATAVQVGTASFLQPHGLDGNLGRPAGRVGGVGRKFDRRDRGNLKKGLGIGD